MILFRLDYDIIKSGWSFWSLIPKQRYFFFSRWAVRPLRKIGDAQALAEQVGAGSTHIWAFGSPAHNYYFLMIRILKSFVKDSNGDSITGRSMITLGCWWYPSKDFGGRYLWPAISCLVRKHLSLFSIKDFYICSFTFSLVTFVCLPIFKHCDQSTLSTYSNRKN